MLLLVADDLILWRVFVYVAGGTCADASRCSEENPGDWKKTQWNPTFCSSAQGNCRHFTQRGSLLNPHPALCLHCQALVQALRQENTDAFAELVENVNLTGTRVSELLRNHEDSLGSQVEGQINSLEQEVERLRWRSADLCLLADIKDPVCFLKVRNISLGWKWCGRKTSQQHRCPLFLRISSAWNRCVREQESHGLQRRQW